MAAATPAYVNLLRCPNGCLVEPPQPRTGFSYFVGVFLKFHCPKKSIELETPKTTAAQSHHPTRRSGR